MNKLVDRLIKRKKWALKLIELNDDILESCSTYPKKPEFFNELDRFQKNRASLINIISKYADQIKEIAVSGGFDPAKVSSKDRTRIAFYLRQSDDFIQKIKEQDLKLSNFFANISSEISREITLGNRHRSKIGSYKSNIKEGNRLNKCL